MKQIHFVLQGKGGVGKSFVAALLAQYLKSTGNEVHCYDTDPVNQTFSRYKKLKVEIVKILTEHKSIDVVNGNLKLTPFRDNRQSKFDPLDDIKSVN